MSEPHVERCYLSLAGALLGALRPLGYEGDLTDLLGRSGLAFRLALDRPLSLEALENLSDVELAERLAPLGADFRRVSCYTTAGDLRARVEMAWSLVLQALGRQHHALAFGLDQTPSYSLILRALDDHHLLVSTPHTTAPLRVGLEALSLTHRLDVIVIEPGPRLDPERAPWAGLAALYAIDWNRGSDIQYGMAAYQRWLTALEHRLPGADHLGIATTLAEMRAHAAAYLRRMAELLPATQSLRGASVSYRQAAALLVELRQLLEGAPELGPEQQVEGARLLAEIMEAEEEGLGYIHATLRSLGL